MSDTMDCKHCREKLNDFVDGGLSADDRRDVERHLANCTSCAHEAAQLRGLSAELKMLPRPMPPIGAFNDLLTAFRAEVAAGNGDITPASPWWKRMHRTLGWPRVAALIFCVVFGSFVAVTNYFDGRKRPVSTAVLAEKSDGFLKRDAADDALAEAQGKPAGEATMSPRIEPGQDEIRKSTAKKEESIESADHAVADGRASAKDSRPSAAPGPSPTASSGAAPKRPTENHRGAKGPGAAPGTIGKGAPGAGDDAKRSNDFARLRAEVENFLGDDATRDSDAEETKSTTPGAGDRAVARADGVASLAWTFLQRERLEVFFDGTDAEKTAFKESVKSGSGRSAGEKVTRRLARWSFERCAGRFSVPCLSCRRKGRRCRRSQGGSRTRRRLRRDADHAFRPRQRAEGARRSPFDGDGEPAVAGCFRSIGAKRRQSPPDRRSQFARRSRRRERTDVAIRCRRGGIDRQGRRDRDRKGPGHPPVG
jgi:hypothetical protein